MLLRKENVILNESNKGRIEELKLQGYEEVTEADLKPKQAKKEDKPKKGDK